MRIALLTEVFLPKIDGVVTRTTRHLDQLAELGHEVLIFAPGNPPERYAGFEVVPIPSRSLKVYPEVMHGMMGPRAFRRLREFDPDIVHAVNPPGYRDWDRLVLPMIDNSIAAARATGARIVLPGTIYNFDPARTPVLTETSPQQPQSRKGQIRREMEARLEAAAPRRGRPVAG